MLLKDFCKAHGCQVECLNSGCFAIPCLNNGKNTLVGHRTLSMCLDFKWAYLPVLKKCPHYEQAKTIAKLENV